MVNMIVVFIVECIVDEVLFRNNYPHWASLVDDLRIAWAFVVGWRLLSFPQSSGTYVVLLFLVGIGKFVLQHVWATKVE
jgi:hypothetical protein